MWGGTGTHDRMRGDPCLCLKRELRRWDDLYQALQRREKCAERDRHHKWSVAPTQRGADGSTGSNSAFGRRERRRRFVAGRASALRRSDG